MIHASISFLRSSWRRALCVGLVLGVAAPTTRAFQVTRFCPADWVPTFDGHPSPLGDVRASLVWDDGSGPAVFIGGQFTDDGSGNVARVLKWDGTNLATVGGPGPAAPLYTVYTLTVFDDGSGPALFAGGTHGLAKWNGSTWTTLGPFGHVQGPSQVAVYASAVYDDGTGPALYVGGAFTTVAGQPVSNVARWNGSTWSPVGGGVGSTASAAGTMTVFDDGNGPALIVGGTFTTAGGQPADGIARWNGSTWSAMGTSPGMVPRVFHVHDAGAGPELYVGGFCEPSLPSTCTSILSKWSGGTWVSLAAVTNGSVLALDTFDDGTGPALVMSGGFATLNGVTVNGLARWNGAAWDRPGTGTDLKYGYALASVDFGRGEELFVLGYLHIVANSKLGDACGAYEVFCRGDGTGAACPCGNSSQTAEQGGCSNSYGVAGTLGVAGVASLASDFLELFFAGTPAGPVLYFQGTSRVNAGLGTPFGDGLRCVGGTIIRLGVKTNANGWSQIPAPGDPSLSALGAVQGPGIRDYQAWYRDSAPFCGPATFNLSNALEIRWAP